MRERDGQQGAGIFGGLLFLALGIILMIGNFDLFPVQPALSQWWPVIFILFGVKHLLQWRGKSAWMGAAFWACIGLLLLSSTLGYLTIGIPSLLWPVVLIWFGVFTVLGSGNYGGSISGRSEP